MNDDVVELQSQLLHLQRHVEQLDDVVMNLGKIVDRQARVIVKLENEFADLRSKPRDAMPDPLDEKPPHY